MSRIFFLLLSLGIAKIANTQSTSTQMGARGLGLGNATNGLVYEWGLFNNVASLGLLTEKSAVAAYHTQFRLTHTHRTAFAVNTPLKTGVLAAGVFRFGDDLYNEQLVSLGFANRFGITALGVTVNYVQYRAHGFQTRQAVTVDFGGITQLSDVITVSASIKNLTQSTLHAKDNPETLPTQLTVGLTFQLNEKILAATELEKDLLFPATWRTGFEYAFNRNFFVRTGFNLQPSSSFFGLGTRKKRLQADYAIQLNSITGAGHQAAVTYSFNRKKI